MLALYSLALFPANHRGPWDHDGGWWPIGPLIFFLFWVIVIAGAVWFITRRGRPHERSGIERARDVLAERFARGEITGEEYRERLSQLQ